MQYVHKTLLGLEQFIYPSRSLVDLLGSAVTARTTENAMARVIISLLALERAVYAHRVVVGRVQERRTRRQVIIRHVVLGASVQNAVRGEATVYARASAHRNQAMIVRVRCAC